MFFVWVSWEPILCSEWWDKFSILWGMNVHYKDVIQNEKCRNSHIISTTQYAIISFKQLLDLFTILLFLKFEQFYAIQIFLWITVRSDMVGIFKIIRNLFKWQERLTDVAILEVPYRCIIFGLLLLFLNRVRTILVELLHVYRCARNVYFESRSVARLYWKATSSCSKKKLKPLP